MNKPAFFGLLLFTLGVQIGLQLYLSKRSKEPVVAQQALNLEVNFSPDEHHEELTTIKTSYATMGFTSKGATLADLTFHRSMDGVDQDFIVLAADQIEEREQQAFVVALDGKTPYTYHLKQAEETAEAHLLSYGVASQEADINKNFIVYKDRPQIDMVLTVKPHVPTNVRVMWPSALLKGLGEDEVISGVMINQKNSFSKIAEKKIGATSYEQPILFGTEDKYFVFAMTKDAHRFAQRSYYKQAQRRVLSLLESAQIAEEKTWHLTFYFGPKDAQMMALVDKNLDKVFDYGLFSFIAKPLLYVLRKINGVVHNYGVAILLITLLLKLLLLPLTWSGARKMKRLQEYQRKMAYLEQKHKGDKQALEAARMEMLQKDGLPLGGCLPLLIQLPFLAALQSGLNNSLELYRAPFFLWIKDLSIADPYYVLPLLILVFFLLGGVIGQKGGGARQNIFMILGAVVFMAFTANLSAGLCLCILGNIALHTFQTELQKAIDV